MLVQWRFKSFTTFLTGSNRVAIASLHQALKKVVASSTP